MAGYIFKEYPLGLDSVDVPGNERPEVARVVLAFALARKRERLAGITGRDEMNAPAPWRAVKAGKVIPDRRVVQGRIFHPRHEGGRSCGFPLDETNSSVSGLCNCQPDVQAAKSGTHGDAIEGLRCGCAKGR